MNWKEVVADLYKKIKPVKADLIYQIDSSFIRDRRIAHMWIEFEMNDFNYVDPFYCEQNSKKMFRMNVSLSQQINELNVTSIYGLENLSIKKNEKNLIGVFSNSLHFSVPEIHFGSLQENKMNLEMEYVLTNSPSHGNMTGTFKEHAQLSCKINTILNIKALIIITDKRENVQEIAAYLDPNFYDIQNIRSAGNPILSTSKTEKYWVPRKTLAESKEAVENLWWQL